jgi:hypothetical protein
VCGNELQAGLGRVSTAATGAAKAPRTAGATKPRSNLLAGLADQSLFRCAPLL